MFVSAMRVLLLGSLVACGVEQAEWACQDDASEVSSGSLSCDEWQESGEQQLEQHRLDCEEQTGATCSCDVDTEACGFDEVND